MKRLILCGLLFLPFLSWAETLSPKAITENLQKNPSIFQKIDLQGVGQRSNLELKFSAESLRIGEAEFSGFRFTAPAGSDAADWIWYFNAPVQWNNWYILPVQGEMSEAFQGKLFADKLYQDLDQPGEGKRFRVFQSLPAGYFRPGQDYIIWFRKTASGEANELRGRILLIGKGPVWNVDTMEKALELHPLDAATQVENINSRGGRILLDPTFFEKDYALGLVDSIFSNFRQVQALPGASFVAVERTLPASQANPSQKIHLQPSFKAIRIKYGPSDFIQGSGEKKRAWLNQGYKEEAVKEESLLTYYYDYFGFEISSADPDEKVIRVVTHLDNYSDLLPIEDGAAFGRLLKKNLTVFYQDKKEVGRFYNFLEDNKIPLVIKEPPVGKYKRGSETIEYLGQSKWLWTMSYPDGSISRKVSLANHLMDGQAKTFFPSGQVQVSAMYRGGRLHGDLIEYSETGDVLRRQTFENGRLQANGSRN